MKSKIRSLLSRGNLTKMLRSAKTSPFPGVIGTFMGRDALSLTASLLDLDANDKVLLPAYLCKEVLRPFIGKTQVEFYDIRPDLEVEPEEIRVKLTENDVKMMIIINYFGFLQPYRKEIKKICEDKGVILIEDCAHSLLTEGSGEIGDLSTYSYRKHLPLPDGGGLKVNMKGKKVSPDYYPRIYSNILSVLIILRLLVNFRTSFVSRAWFASRKTNHSPNATLANNKSRVLPQSLFSYNGMGNMSFSEIFERRRNDYMFWQELSEKTDEFIPVFDNLPPGVCPLGFPVKVKNRDLLKSRLERLGIPSTIEWSLPTIVGKDFVNSHELSKQILTLPVNLEMDLRERKLVQKIFY